MSDVSCDRLRMSAHLSRRSTDSPQQRGGRLEALSNPGKSPQHVLRGCTRLRLHTRYSILASLSPDIVVRSEAHLERAERDHSDLIVIGRLAANQK